MKKAAIFGLVLVLIAGIGLIISCEGPVGATGKQGIQGEKGDKGDDGADGTAILWQGVLASAPANPQNGWAYYNTTDGRSYIYWGSWQVLTRDGEDGIDGIDILWKGELADHPVDPELNWAYYNNVLMTAYIYDGTSWSILSKSPDAPIPGFPLKSSYDGQPRLIVTTDPEMDDLASLTHMLLYSNEINIIGLIVSDSQWHYRGYPDGQAFPGSNAARLFGYRWPGKDNDLPPGNSPGGSNDVMHIDLALKTYRDAYPMLVKHDSNYPPPYKLENLVYYGNITGDPTIPANSAGSDFIASILLDNVPGKVFAQGWGGNTTIARALRRIRTTSNAAWQTRAAPGGDIHNKIVDKLVVSSFGFQELGGPNMQVAFHEFGQFWPDLEYRQVSQQIWGYSHRNAIYPDVSDMTRWPWTQRIVNVGPHGSMYWIVGTSGRSADWDNDNRRWLVTDSENNADQRTGTGGSGTYGDFISEGDSSNWAMLVQNGLRNWEDPTWGGWGGRQKKRIEWMNGWTGGTSGQPGHPATIATAGYTGPTAQWDSLGVNAPTNWWTNARVDNWSTFASDFNRDMATGLNRNDSACARWAEYWWRQFAARLQWTIKGPAECNHPPTISVSNSITNDDTLDISAAAGTIITLNANTSDPGGRDVDVTWWHYIEAGTYGNYQQTAATSFSYKGTTYNPAANEYVNADLQIPLETNTTGTTCILTVPADANPGDTIHIMAEATNHFTPDPELNLTTWKRIVVTVN